MKGDCLVETTEASHYTAVFQHPYVYPAMKSKVRVLTSLKAMLS